MTLLSKPIDHLVSLVKTPSTATPTLQKAVYDIVRKSEQATRQDIELALQSMSTLVSQAELFPAALIAIGCGALIEKGIDPEIASTPILQRTREALRLAPTFGLACQAAARNSPGKSNPEGIEECIKRYGQTIAKEMPDEAGAWLALPPICTAALAVLTRLPQVRETLRNDAEFMFALEAFPAQNASIDCLHELLCILENEEMIVLHPTLRQGYRIRIQGVGDNFQLHTLLADALIGDPNQGWLPGKRPDPRVVAAAKDGPFPMPDKEDNNFPAAEGAFNLWNWQGLQPDGTLPQGYSKREHWIWNEGKPTDIAHFEGIRVILLSPPPYPRAWSAGRYFPGLRGELEVLKVLSQMQVDEWLARIMVAVTQSET